VAIDPIEAAQFFNQNRDGWCTAMGLVFVRASRDEVVAEVEVGPAHLQAYGVVHGGVYSGILETLASVGAAIDAMEHGRSIVGLENHTSFVRAIRQGKLTTTVKPVTRGRRSQLWEGAVMTSDGKVAARGTVRLLCLEPGADLAGEKAGLKEAPAGMPPKTSG
jgi:1,4-dihydroxy-2-naphthoyl-CoA hydrolase